MRAAYGLSPVLQQSLSASEDSFLNDSGLEEAGEHCRRGSTKIL